MINTLLDTIKGSIATESSSHVKITERSFLYTIFGHSDERYTSNWRVILNFVLLLSSVLATLVALVFMFVFFISEVLLHSYNSKINGDGSLYFEQPCAREHYLYLLNTSQCWANTGIMVSDGDKVTVSVSGSMYSSISELVYKAEANDTLRWDFYNHQAESGDTSRYAMKTGDPIGTLLYQVRPSGTMDVYQGDDIFRVESEPMEITKTGTLRFAVNDVYFTDAVLDKMKDQQPWKGTDSIFVNECDFLALKGQIENDPKMRKIWYDDNCGELLLNISVERNLANVRDLMFIDRVYYYLYRLFVK